MPSIMNTTEIESALVNLQATHPELCHLIALPEKTFEGRACHALRIAKDYRKEKPGILILGGVHAREWGGPDIVVNFAADLMKAYSHRKGLKYLKKTFQAREIQTVIEDRTVVIFPCVNPDGVEFSHTKIHLWRKNRNPTYSKGDPKKIGVDINRNYDFLWDFKKFFHPAAWNDSLASDDPSIETFHGPSPFSEPETRNVKWLMDQFAFAIFLDLHSYAGDVLYSWGDDNDQSSTPEQNFTNHAYDGKRGLLNDSYREYVDPTDYATSTSIALLVSDAMKAVRNRLYKPVQSVGLYPTSGASDDYAFSRHIVNPGVPKTFGFTLEFNFVGDGRDPFLATADPKTLRQTMRDVIPGLITLCLAVSQIGSVARLDNIAREVDLKPPMMLSERSPFRTSLASEMWRLLIAYEMIASIGGRGGAIAREGLLKAIQAVAAPKAKLRA
jgi:hypothetical protein